MDVTAAVSDHVRSVGFEVTAPVELRSTNNLVVWLAPSPVVAKISDDRARALGELEIARALVSVEAPIVSPIDVGMEQPLLVGGKTVTFWKHQPQVDADVISARDVAHALFILHSKLAAIGGEFDLPNFDERLYEAVDTLDHPDIAHVLSPADRLLLRTTLVDRIARLVSTRRGAQVLHGSPHRLNILSVDGDPCFIDLETVERGPVEWDLAHLEPGVADLYPARIDREALATCRIMVSAATSLWCWQDLERGSDMRVHAEHHLAIVRAAGGGADGHDR
jgi:Phosphotransferase enzyme family